MKTLLCCLLALSLLLCFSGCQPSSDTPPTGTSATQATTTSATAPTTTTTTLILEMPRPTVDPADIGQLGLSDFTVYAAGVTIRPGEDAAPLLAALGEPKKVEESTMFGGLWVDGLTYYDYPGISVAVVTYEDKQEIESIHLHIDSFLLYKDVAVGCTRDDLLRLYGVPTYDFDEYNKTSIQYQLMSENVNYSLFFDFTGTDENGKYAVFDTVQRIAVSSDAYLWAALER